MSDSMNAALFNKQGSSYYLGSKESTQHAQLPPGNYVIKRDGPMQPLSLGIVDSFELPKKLYGRTNNFSERVLKTFNDRPNTTGILLSGEKGSGKTLQAKAISNLAAKEGYPTLIVNAAWSGDEFNMLLQRIKQPCVVFFDEFEKVYQRDDQQEILTLFDGVFPSKKLFMLTCNDKYSLDSHLSNRPGRLFYAIEYEGLDEEFIREYCVDNLKNQSYIDKICDISKMFGAFNFDILKAMVEEMNRYDESPAEVLQVLNASLRGETYGTFEISLRHKDPTKLVNVKMDTKMIEKHPLSQNAIGIWFEDFTGYDAKDPESVYPDNQQVVVYQRNFKGMQGGNFVFETEDGVTVTFKRRSTSLTTHYSSIFD